MCISTTVKLDVSLSCMGLIWGYIHRDNFLQRKYLTGILGTIDLAELSTWFILLVNHWPKSAQSPFQLVGIGLKDLSVCLSFYRYKFQCSQLFPDSFLIIRAFWRHLQSKTGAEQSLTFRVWEFYLYIWVPWWLIWLIDRLLIDVSDDYSVLLQL